MKPGIAEIRFAEMYKLSILNKYVFDTFLSGYVWKYSELNNMWYLISENKKDCILSLTRWGKCFWKRKLHTEVYERYMGLSLSEFRMIIRVYIKDTLDRDVDESKVTNKFIIPPDYFFNN